MTHGPVPRAARRSLKRCLLASLLLSGCVEAPPPKPAPPPPPTLRPQGTARVVLVSFDGLSADAVSAASTPSFAAMPVHVTRVVPVTPALTAPTHAAIITGAPPEVSGVVANRFHLVGHPVNDVAEGFTVPLRVETLVGAAHRQGKRVGSIAFPTVDGTTPERRANFAVTFTRPIEAPARIELHRADFRAEWVPPGWPSSQPKHPSFSPVMRARFEWQGRNADLVAYDSTDDRQRNYDAFYVESGGEEEALDANGWFALSARIGGDLAGSWSKLLHADPSLDSVTIYRGATTRTTGYPDEFKQLVEQTAGFPPGQADDRAALTGEIDLRTFEQQLAREADYYERVTGIAIRQMPFDLLLAYQPVIDESEHPFHGQEPVAFAYGLFDRAVAAMEAELDPTRYALVVTGDHGIAAIDTEVRINAILASWGYTQFTSNKLSEQTRWAAYASGSCAQLYRFAAPDDADELVNKLTDLKAPDGSAVVERIDRKPSPNAGDLVVYLYPRFVFSTGPGEPFGKPAGRGQHGGIGAHPEYHTTLGAWGAAAGQLTEATAPQTDIARYVSALLGIDEPGAARH